jgi:2-polyprenyl-3-methyl-5-hydroxy-6-metoxy-1,4-benzoquinol methylase
MYKRKTFPAKHLTQEKFETMSNNSIAHFNQAASQWDTKPMRVVLAEAVAQSIAQHIALQPYMQAMDYGCGTGLVSLALAPQLGTVLGIDSASEMLKVMQDKAQAQNLHNVQTQRLDLTQEQLPEQKFDLIFSSMTLHHIADTAHILNAFFQHLKPNGQIALADLDKEDGSFHPPDAQGVMHHGFERISLHAQAELVGFRHVEFNTAHSIHKAETQRDYPIFLMTARKPVIL